MLPKKIHFTKALFMFTVKWLYDIACEYFSSGFLQENDGLLELQVVMKWFEDSTYILEAAAVTGALISLLIKAVLFWGLVRLHSFDQRERSECAAFPFMLSVLRMLLWAEDKTDAPSGGY